MKKWIEVDYSKEKTDSTIYVEVFETLEEAEKFVSEMLEGNEYAEAISITECKTLKVY